MLKSFGGAHGHQMAQRCNPEEIVLLLPCQAGRIQKTSLYAHPGLHHNSPLPSATAEAGCLEGHVRATGHLLGPPGQPALTIFRIQGLVCYTALASARPSRSSALHHGAPLAEMISQVISSYTDAGLHASKVFLPIYSCIFCPVHNRESLAAPNLEYDYLTRKTGRMRPLWIAWQRDAETAAGWSAIVLLKTWRCGGNAHVQIYLSICVYLCLHLYYYI